MQVRRGARDGRRDWSDVHRGRHRRGGRAGAAKQAEALGHRSRCRRPRRSPRCSRRWAPTSRSSTRAPRSRSTSRRRRRSPGQIQGGAPADVFASADGANMQKVVSSGAGHRRPRRLHRQPADDRGEEGQPEEGEEARRPARTSTSSRCARRRCRAGKYATQMLTQDGITIPQEKITLGQDVKATLAAVSAG